MAAQVKSRQLWGQDVYTDDSDLVAVLLHLGYYASNATAPHPLVSRFFAQLSLLPPREAYVSCFRNAVRSRGWFSKVEGCSFKVRARRRRAGRVLAGAADEARCLPRLRRCGARQVRAWADHAAPSVPLCRARQVDRCWLVTRSNRQLELSPRVDDAAISHPTYALTNLDRQMATRAAAGASRNKPVSEVIRAASRAASRCAAQQLLSCVALCVAARDACSGCQRRGVLAWPADRRHAACRAPSLSPSPSHSLSLRQVTVLYNLVNEPWLKYSMAAIADRGLKSAGWTSARLREEALYLETSRWA